MQMQLFFTVDMMVRVDIDVDNEIRLDPDAPLPADQRELVTRLKDQLLKLLAKSEHVPEMGAFVNADPESAMLVVAQRADLAYQDSTPSAQRWISEDERSMLFKCQDPTDQAILDWALNTAGWCISRASLYDEEGIEGYIWEHAVHSECYSFSVDGDWQNGPEIPDEIRKLYLNRG